MSKILGDGLSSIKGHVNGSPRSELNDWKEFTA